LADASYVFFSYCLFHRILTSIRYRRRFKERQLTGVVYSFKSAENRMDDRHRDIYGYIFTNMPAVVALVDRGRPRFHKHEIGRHCDSRRDSTRWNSLLRWGRSSALTKLAAFDRWRCRSSSTLWRFSSRYANPLLSKFYSTLTISILLGTRRILLGGDVLKFLRHPRRSGRTCVNLKKRPPSFSKVAPSLYPACTCASMISLQR